MDSSQVFVFLMTTLVCSTIIVLGIVRAIAGRKGSKRGDPRIEEQFAERLGRIEQAIDTVAVEVERVSESQRFVTRILAERTKAAPPVLGDSTTSPR